MKRVLIISSILFLSSIYTIGILSAQTTIKGKVVEKETNEPLVGAVVTLKSSTEGFVTDQNGEFSIHTDKSGPQDVKVKLIGYDVFETRVDDDSKPLSIKLESSDNPLDQVVVVGYGAKTKEQLTASISSITSETIKNAPVENILEALQGRIAGLNITQSSGLPGAASTVEVRGLNTFTASGGCACCGSSDPTYSEPLIIIDGVPFQSKSSSALSLGSIGEINPLSTLSPSDVDRIDVLKDADATSIYGSRGSNGVILISTKRVNNN